MSFLATQLIGFGAGASGFVGYATEYTTPGTETIAKPLGATSVTIECIGAGGLGTAGGKGGGGGGGAYSKRLAYSVTGLSDVYLVIPASNAGAAQAKENTSGGTVICSANGGADGSAGNNGGSTGGTGDTKYAGGIGTGGGGGGGAAGPSGAGSNAAGNAGGSSGGSPGGNGGNSGVAGSSYGGGGGTGNNAGGSGYVKLTWA